MHRPTATHPNLFARRLRTSSLATVAALGATAIFGLACDRKESPAPEAAASSAETAAEKTAEPAKASDATASGSAATPGPILDCVAKGNARPICKFQSPEDMVALPGNEALLISGYGALAADGSMKKPGAIVLFPLATEMPPDASLNEVVGLPNGDFYTTKMASLAGASGFTEGIPTEPTGHAFAWSAKDGYRKIEGTDGVMPNGIAASADGKTLYLDVTMQNEVRKIDVATGKLLGKASVKMPDNITWAPDGKRLLAASLHGFETTNFSVCVDVPQGACPIPFAIQAIDAETMTPLGPVYESTGAPMGGGTVGLQVGDELFIGSFTGDRILRVALAKP
jgi:hypothetical protein